MTASTQLSSDDEPDLKALVQQEITLENDPEQSEFNKLSKDVKLDRLNVLIQKSQIYSQIIADNILERSLSKPEPVPKTKKRKVSKNRDVTQMLKSKASQNTQSTRKAIEDSQSGATIKQPNLVTGGTLKNYQLDGLQWLVTLFENGLNGILADEMGLGKTIQCISFLSFLIDKGIKGPFLIVVPLSTLTNWAREFETFAPGILVFKFTGTKQARARVNLAKVVSKVSVILVSNETSIREFRKLRSINWKYLIVDEGHRLKNNDCVLIKVLKQLPTSNRLLITGTPLQNNLNELWSLLNFILPDIFHDLELFQQWFNFEELTDFSKDDDEETKNLIKVNLQENLIKNLHTILKPFILRRLKRDVIRNLPPKKEYLIHIPLTKVQKSLYFDAINNNLFTSLVELYFKEFLNYNHPEFKSQADYKLIDKYLDSKTQPQSFKKKERRSYKEAESDDEFELEEHEVMDRDVTYPEVLQKIQEDSIPPSRAKKLILETLYDKVHKEIKNLSLQNMMMQLRNICGSPYLYYEPFLLEGENTQEEKFMDILFKNSAKLHVLNQLCENLFKDGHKVLIFSQFTRMLNLLQDWFRAKDVSVSRLDGSVDMETRDAEINTFNTDPNTMVFLLSTRSGGLGINLTAADTVILFDNDWNPQMDLQAIDRVHRIGQTKPVKIYRFLIRNSIEEILISKSSSKRFLEKLIIQMGEFKFNKLKKLMGLNDDVNLNVKELVEMSKITFKDDDDKEDHSGFSYVYGSDDYDIFELKKNELHELLDRSPACYNGKSEFDNITVFETVNNLDANEIQKD